MKSSKRQTSIPGSAWGPIQSGSSVNHVRVSFGLQFARTKPSALLSRVFLESALGAAGPFWCLCFGVLRPLKLGISASLPGLMFGLWDFS